MLTSPGLTTIAGQGVTPDASRVQFRTAGALPVARCLSDPTDLLHYWSLRAPARGSTLNTVTLYRVSDAAQADFAFDARGRLPLSAIQAWAGATSGTTQVRVARVWDSSATQLGPELVTSLLSVAAPLEIVLTPGSVLDGQNLITSLKGGLYIRVLDVGAIYRIELVGTLSNLGGGEWFTAGLRDVVGEPPATSSVVYQITNNITVNKLAYLTAPASTGEGPLLYFRFSANGSFQFSKFSMRRVFVANAVQTTVSAMPFFDLATGGVLDTSGSSLVATLRSQITNGKEIVVRDGALYQNTITANVGSYTVQSAHTLSERAIFKSDTPDLDVERARRAMIRYWSATDVATLYVLDDSDTPQPLYVLNGDDDYALLKVKT